jgi:hypothetical protein
MVITSNTIVVDVPNHHAYVCSPLIGNLAAVFSKHREDD